MRVPSRGREYGLQFNLTPLIDIVFLLLIFFLVASYLSNSQIESGVELAHVRGGRPDRESTARRIVITIRADGTLSQGAELISHTGFEALLLAVPTEERPTVEVRLRADERAPFETIEPLLQACARAGITQLKFHVLQGE